MGKYIEADRLKAEIERRKQSLRAGICSYRAFTREQKREMLVASEEIDRFNRIIDSLRQEHPEVDLEKAARHVYESWMGGTMDDVRRDMVELGNVLNARKEE